MSDYLTTSFTDYYTNSYSNASATSLSSSLKNTDFSNATDEELMDACKSFENYFIEQVMKGMEKTIVKADDDSSSSSNSYYEMFKDNLYEEYAEKISDGEGLGLAQQLYEQMKRNYGL